ncbi:MAG TPA: ATP-dependent RNA helicase HrpA [Opitutaceae bacterium]|nr:ATP-dependent RNA helicase HrpA [Opitutaceae bacterium]
MSSAAPFPFRLDFPPELPISARAEEIVATLQAHQIVILAGETGSGKTTQIPKMCLAAGRGRSGRIACTQPRRVAALSVSKRVAEELGVNWGREVGCKIRFDDKTSRETVIKFLTDGMLLAEVQNDPLLRAYDTIIIDEAHERSLNIDFLLGHFRTLRFKRPELKIVITSATIDTAAFSEAFDGAPVIEVSGRTYPVEVIHAPLDELGSDAADGDEAASRAEALHYIDGALEALERIVETTTSGDVLIFLPAERDIRELRELVDGRRLRDCEVVPLFGRLSNAEQQRVFAPSPKRKIVIATNIAETSLTIPGIRFVIDTGLARISRYSPQGRTRRLPIEEISQSSADQRKGRCGRVAEGVCIRLYSEKDYLERPRFTQPEIQRANLADVILRMKAFGLGDIERFPFINMPASKAIRAGYALLEELGALETPSAAPENSTQNSADASRVLTKVGRELARLPVDPTVGRMILQARQEKCLHEALIIAAGLSIQDPRERPLDAREKADAAHRGFIHADSDFLTLLNIWDAFHDQVESLSQSRLRRFCREHFLSYTRMREWRDIHNQLVEVLKERDDFRATSVFDGLSAKQRAEKTNADLAWGSPGYRAIHRAILAGLLSNIAVRDHESGLYKATHDRRVALFPGSALFVRENSKRRDDAKGGAKREGKAPRWIMAAEIMETSRLYARTCARLDPVWALDLGQHLLRVSHSEPFWNGDAGRVLVKQRSRLYGLELESRAVGYSKVDPRHATEIFIREALVNDTLTWPFDFLAENRLVRERIENLLTRARHGGYMNLDEGAYRFYAARLIDWPDEAGEFTPVASVPELVDLVRQRKAQEPNFLVMKPEDLRDPEELLDDTVAFPEALPLENRALPLTYAYKPGLPEDGVTLEVNVREAEAITAAELDWAVPGHFEAKVEHFLRAAPKEVRRIFVPLTETSRAIAAELKHRRADAEKAASAGKSAKSVAGSLSELAPLGEAVAQIVAKRFGIQLPPTIWEAKPLPDHLRVRLRVLDDDGREICATRDLAEAKAAVQARSRELSERVSREDPDAWRNARAKWEKPEQTVWTFGAIPGEIIVSEQAGLPVLAYPALRPGPTGVSLRLCKTPEEAENTMRAGLAYLLGHYMKNDLAWLQKELRRLRELGALPATLASFDELQSQGNDSLRRWLCASERVYAQTETANADRGGRPTIAEKDFLAAVEGAKLDARTVVPKLIERLREILEVRQSLLVHPQPYASLAADLAQLLPADFLRATPYPRLAHLARYLKAMKLRADRWRQNPAKENERLRLLAPYAAAVEKILRKPSAPTPAEESFRWLFEELRVSLFAQELGTAEPVSLVKMERALAALKSGVAMADETPARSAGAQPAAGSAAPPQKPPLVTSTGDKKTAPVKSLGALDSLFRR